MITFTRFAAATVLAASLLGRNAQAQSIVGTWNGATTTQQGTQGVTFTFDSVATGWKGSWSTETYGGGALSGIETKKDTVWFSLSIQNTSIDMQGTLSADKKTITGFLWIGGADGGTFKVSKAEPAKAPPTHHHQ